MKNGQQEFQPGIPLGRTWSKLQDDLSQRDILQRPYGNHQRLEYHQEFQTPECEGKQDKGESSHYPSYKKTSDPDRAYCNSFRPTRSRPNQLYRSFQEKTRIQGQKQDHLQAEEERVSPNDPQVVVISSKMSSPINKNITPSHIQHNVVIPESNLDSDALWLQMFQYSEKTQQQFSELEASHERIKILTASMDKIVKIPQEGHAQVSKASEEINKRMNLVFEEQQHNKRCRDHLDQDIHKLFNVYHSMKPQTQGHVLDNT
ncbi:hypothetical protein O181_095418 [Austropuccinia psidii MF-1]|uniref:Uncharacterized protein n=1 Tax=Austropuccinia psidii MF-1 TaxID=1389203 RepID=A0A9Q3J508_9BASI|nr:hypothetical protein [Austropuccinia psidii MF-1]